MRFDKKIFFFCLIGFLFTNVLGSLSHFFYEWSNGSPVLAVFFPVNESTWEHLKLAIFPVFLYFGVGAFFMRKTPNYPAAAFFCVLSAIVFIPAVFYFYTAIVGRSVVFMDILTFTLSLFVGFTVAYYLMTAAPRPVLNIVSYCGIAVILILYFTLTYFPPHCFLFRDPISGGYGIIS